jgi:serine/threonine-protein kinase
MAQSTNGRDLRKRLFLRDADVLGVLGEFPHPNIARCYPPFLWEGDTLALPLEWIDGPTLHDLLLEEQKWSFKQRIRIFKQICKGLEHAHRLGVIHRMISPQNIVLLARNNVKIVNFSFAKVDPTLFTTTMDKVTQRLIQEADWRYAAPELKTLGGTVTPAADIFSTGVLLFELMTGRCPFKDHTIKLNSVLPRPSQINPELSATIDGLFMQMCAFEPAGRIQTMTEVLKQLQEI